MNILNKSPNIVFILTDDQGYWSMGCYGNKEIRTPNIDKLAQDGIKFENFFCVSPVCSPARASILTGKIPSQHGIHDWIRIGNGDSPNDVTSVAYLEGHIGYTELLKQAGYVCAQSGKWHLGATSIPQKGYSHWFTTCGGSGTYHDAKAYTKAALIQTKGYLTDVICDDALSFIDEQCNSTSNNPFYLNVAFTAPHSPHVDQHKQEYVDYYYHHCTFSDVRQDPRNPWSLQHPVDIQYSESFCNPSRNYLSMRDLLSGYYAAIQGIDDAVGRIVDKLEERGIRENTIIVFTSDNGFACGQHGIWGKGNATQPLNVYDTCIKVPCIFNCPGLLANGVVSTALTSAYDFFPTILELASIDYSEINNLPGRSFAKTLMEGDQGEYHEHVTIFDEYGQVRMIRTKDWKYIHRYPEGPNELYELIHDPHELFNLLHENRFFLHGPDGISKKASEMKSQMEAWFTTYTNSLYDGKSEPVAGRGQLGKLEHVHGEAAFYPWVQIEYQRKE